MKAKGVQVHQADPAVVEATRSFVEGYLKAMPATYQQRYGVTRGEEILTDFRTILIKWVGLARTAKTREDLARLLLRSWRAGLEGNSQLLISRFSATGSASSPRGRLPLSF